MNVLVLGSAGNMGRRYCAILNFLGVDFVGFDISTGADYGSLRLYEFTHVLIATPVNTHIGLIFNLHNVVGSILCEKPISISVDDLLNLQMNQTSVYMVNNWRFILGVKKLLSPGQNEIALDYYNTGKDGDWDLIQPIYLSRGMPTIKRKSPVYDCNVNGTMITQHNFDMSYVAMIRAWLDTPQLMWNLDDAINATKKTIKYIGRREYA